MLFLVAALLLMGIALGTAAHLPVPVTLLAAAVIAGWLLVFFLRERRHRSEVTSR
ncbi:small hydrophobic membrane protein [Streptomyces lydicus]|uniref:small hydrophobic membrane protein n=2 Tax=Streptomyces lydicus TaxID=47763 RepID=UPI00052723D7|nr:small hydrophobic membrane protein [Streptomyces lydicus]